MLYVSDELFSSLRFYNVHLSGLIEKFLSLLCKNLFFLWKAFAVDFTAGIKVIPDFRRIVWQKAWVEIAPGVAPLFLSSTACAQASSQLESSDLWTSCVLCCCRLCSWVLICCSVFQFPSFLLCFYFYWGVFAPHLTRDCRTVRPEAPSCKVAHFPPSYLPDWMSLSLCLWQLPCLKVAK